MRIAIVCIVLLVACGGGGGYDSQRDAVIAVGTAFCDRAIECGAVPAAGRDDCEAEFASVACGATVRGRPFEGDEDAVDTCIAILDGWSCTADVLPPECQDVL